MADLARDGRRGPGPHRPRRRGRGRDPGGDRRGQGGVPRARGRLADLRLPHPADLSTVGIYAPEDPRVSMLRDFGMVDAAAVAEAIKDGEFYGTVSAERAAELESDVLVTWVEKPRTRRPSSTTTCSGQIPAIASGTSTPSPTRRSRWRPPTRPRCPSRSSSRTFLPKVAEAVDGHVTCRAVLETGRDRRRPGRHVGSATDRDRPPRGGRSRCLRWSSAPGRSRWRRSGTPATRCTPSRRRGSSAPCSASRSAQPSAWPAPCLQGLTRNPLADPGILGINAGASFADGRRRSRSASPTCRASSGSPSSAPPWPRSWSTLIASLGRDGATPMKLAIAGAAVTRPAQLDHRRPARRPQTMETFRFWQVGHDRRPRPRRAARPVLRSSCGRCSRWAAPACSTRSRSATTWPAAWGAVRPDRVAARRRHRAAGRHPTALAGPIAFVGLVVPHAVRASSARPPLDAAVRGARRRCSSCSPPTRRPGRAAADRGPGRDHGRGRRRPVLPPPDPPRPVGEGACDRDLDLADWPRPPGRRRRRTRAAAAVRAPAALVVGRASRLAACRRVRRPRAARRLHGHHPRLLPDPGRRAAHSRRRPTSSMESKLPRAVLGVLVGVAFGVGGAIFQTTLRNPLASPDIIGVSPGRAAAVSRVALGRLDRRAVSAAAVARRDRRRPRRAARSSPAPARRHRLVLVGIGLAAAMQSVIQYLFTRVDESTRSGAAVADRQRQRRGLADDPPAGPGAGRAAPAVLAGRSLRATELGDDAAAGLGVTRCRTDLLLLLGVVLIAVGRRGRRADRLRRVPRRPDRPRAQRRPDHAARRRLVGAVIVVAADYVADYLIPDTNLRSASSPAPSARRSCSGCSPAAAPEGGRHDRHPGHGRAARPTRRPRSATTTAPSSTTSTSGARRRGHRDRRRQRLRQVDPAARLARLLRPGAGAVLLDGEAIHRQPTRAGRPRPGPAAADPDRPEGVTVVDLVGRGRHPHQGCFRRWTRGRRGRRRGAGRSPTPSTSPTGRRRALRRPAAAGLDRDGPRAGHRPAAARRAHDVPRRRPPGRDARPARRASTARAAPPSVMVLHDLNLAARYADHLVALRGGGSSPRARPARSSPRTSSARSSASTTG